MSQEERVESFVSDERDFATFWQGVRRDEEKYGRSVNREFSFKDAYIKSLFGFCSYILELLGNVNILFQERLRTMAQLWDVVLSLKNEILSLIFQTNGDGSTGVGCLNGLNKEEMLEFQSSSDFIACLGDAFPMSVQSVEMRGRCFSDSQIVSLQNCSLFQGPHCSVLPFSNSWHSHETFSQQFPHQFVKMN